MSKTRRFVAFASVLACAIAAVAYNSILVDLSVVPPVVIHCDGRIGMAEVVDDGVVVEVLESEDTSFAFVWRDGFGDVSPEKFTWVASSFGAPVGSGIGLDIPFSEMGSVDAVCFRIPEEAVDWGGLGEIRCSPTLAAAESSAPARTPSGVRALSSDGGRDQDSASIIVDPGEFTYDIQIGEPFPLDFTFFDVSAPGGIVQRNGLPICNGNGPYHSNVVCVVATGWSFTPPSDGFCTVSCASDDKGSISVGDACAESSLFSPASCTAFLNGGQAYAVGATFSSIGGPFFYDADIVFTPVPSGSDDCPHLVVSQAVVRVSINQGGATVDKSHEVYVVGTEHPEEYAIACDDPPGGVRVEGGRFVIDPSDSAFWRGVEDKSRITVHYLLLGAGGQIDRQPAYFEIDRVKEEDDECGCESCNEGTQVRDGSVEFEQRFGRTPRIPGLPTGALRICETGPSARLGIPAVLFYDHPMNRRILTRRGLDAVVVDASGSCTEYVGGYPAHASAGHNGQIYILEDGCIAEVLPDRTQVAYDPTGSRVVAIAPPDGGWVEVGELGISCGMDAGGCITNITSEADGRIDVERVSTNKWTAVWTSPTGAFVKSFKFSFEDPDVFTLHEHRDETFEFDYRWTYSDAARDWVLEKGYGTDSATREEKSMEWDSTNRVWEVVSRLVDRSGAGVVSSRTVLDTERGVGRALARRTGAQLLYTAGRDEATGLITNECRLASAPRSYVYDSYGRVLEESTCANGGLERTVSYRYADPEDGRALDRRPTNTVERLSGTVVLEVDHLYSSNAVDIVRRAGGAERRSREEFDAFGRRTLRVSEDGRARRTEYVDSDEDSSWVELSEEGLWSEAGGFALVDGRSELTRDEHDVSGNVIRRTRYVRVGGDWRETGWTTNVYNASHKVVFTGRSDGRTSAAEWICTGSVWERDEEGVIVSNRYDAVKRRASSTRYAPWGAVTTAYAYDAAGRIVRETTSADGCETRTIERTEDERGRVVALCEDGDRVTLMDYSDDDLITTVTYADGGTRVTTLNADGSLHSVTGTAVTPEFHTYGVTDEGLEWECVRYGRADSPRFEKTYRNGFGETVRVERSGFDGATLVLEQVYDAKGQLVASTETGRPSATYAYDDWGERVSETLSADGVSRIVENATEYVVEDGEVWRERTQVSRSGDAAIAPLVTMQATKVSGLSLSAIEESFSVDVRGNTNRVTVALDPSICARTTTQTVLGASNRAVSMLIDGFENSSIGVNGASTIAFADAYRRELTHRDGRGNVTSTSYGVHGQAASWTDAAGKRTSYAYDPMDRLAATTNALGLVTTCEYDARGNKTYEGGATYPVRYAYDVYGNRVSMTTYRDEDGAAGDTTSWVYDEASGLVTEKRYADGSSVCYTYSDDGKLTSRAWARGVVTTYAYDGWGNLTSTTYSDGTPSVTLSYDALGRLVTANDVVGTTTYSYDEYGDEVEVATSGLYLKTLTRHRDEYGRDLGHTMDGSRKNIIEYEPTTGRIRRTMLGGAWFTWDYLAGSDLKSRLTYGGSGNTEWTYEPNRDLLTRVKNTIYGAVVSQYDYTNDAIGRRTAIARSGTKMSEQRSDAYGYNDRSELTNAVKNATLNEYAYQYDDIGNRETSVEPNNAVEYTANNLNQYTQIAEGEDVYAPQYDADGNQTLVKTKTGVWSVTYNGENRPVLWTCGTTNLVMKFDRMGRRVEYIETVGPVTNKHQKFVYDGYLCIQRLNGSNNSITELFEWDPTEKVATRPMFMQYRVPGQTYALFYTHDGNKNVSEVIHFSRANGIAAHYEYAPFGEVTAQVCQGGIAAYDFAALNPWRFSSEYADDASGTVYYNYRHYEPMMGRWMSRDPIGELVSVGLFLVSYNSLIIATDVLGLTECDKFYADTIKKVWVKKESSLKKWFKANAPKGCLLPAVKCECCNRESNGFTQGGSARHTSNGNSEITICKDDKNNSETVIEEILRHELFHAIDYCKTKRKFTCEEGICSEIRAYSGVECANLFGDLKKECVKNAAKVSLERFAPCKGRNVDQLVNAAVDKGICD